MPSEISPFNGCDYTNSQVFPPGPFLSAILALAIVTVPRTDDEIRLDMIVLPNELMSSCCIKLATYTAILPPNHDRHLTEALVQEELQCLLTSSFHADN